MWHCLLVAQASATRESVHELIVRTFDTPTKCDVCTSVMFGLVRQGLVCKSKYSHRKRFSWARCQQIRFSYLTYFNMFITRISFFPSPLSQSLSFFLPVFLPPFLPLFFLASSFLLLSSLLQTVRWAVTSTVKTKLLQLVLFLLDRVSFLPNCKCLRASWLSHKLYFNGLTDWELAFFLLIPQPAKLPFGIDIHHGVGTACEGWIKIPKPGGVRRGWQRAYAIVCDFKVFLHEPSNDIHAPAAAATHIFDIRYLSGGLTCSFFMGSQASNIVLLQVYIPSILVT